MNNPFFWLAVSILLVALSLMALLTVAILTLQELARAAKSAEKLLDMLNRELPATLQDIRLTGKELSGLTDEVSSGVQSARSVVQQVDQSLLEAKAHAQKAQITTRSLFAGATAALQALTGPPRRRRRPPTRRPPIAQPTAEPASHNSNQSKNRTLTPHPRATAPALSNRPTETQTDEASSVQPTVPAPQDSSSH